MSRRDKGHALSGTPAVTVLEQKGLAYVLHPYVHDDSATSYGDEAARALGVDPMRIFKTLVVDGDHGLAVAVVPVARQVDLKAAAHALGAKRLTLADQQHAQRSTGYVTGGISPIGQRKALPTVVDESALGWDTLFVSAGRRGLQVELAPRDLVEVTAARTAAIAR
jgi:Cys-tRNA(Pro)/Cys-tRNA(Cys) deacylase